MGLGCKLPQRGPGQNPGKFGFWCILGPRKSRQNGQLAFKSGATNESGGTTWHVPPCPNVEPSLPLFVAISSQLTRALHGRENHGPARLGSARCFLGPARPVFCLKFSGQTRFRPVEVRVRGLPGPCRTLRTHRR